MFYLYGTAVFLGFFLCVQCWNLLFCIWINDFMSTFETEINHRKYFVIDEKIYSYENKSTDQTKLRYIQLLTCYHKRGFTSLDWHIIKILDSIKSTDFASRVFRNYHAWRTLTSSNLCQHEFSFHDLVLVSNSFDYMVSMMS